LSTEFELEGRRFEVQRLGPEDACVGMEVLGKALGPALSAILLSKAAGDEGLNIDFAGLLQSLLTQASQIMVLVRLFAPSTKYDRSSNGVMVDLKPFLKGRGEIFEGRIDLMLAFLVHAVRGEYTSFLGGPNALVQLLAQLAGPLSPSPPAPTG
jgi:hypothetical protein